ncbi:hypothetical protein Enr17x_57930 [Gimesia fumaroli]|uniref:Uncharacterized protein n=1 Tax=Gimesia fumaroli TaxID=2527976 RepID=A0A518IKV1_9PLAN|nr:hypothetical protein Enr17x_57930 [Gimesia fumaroli]
MLELAFNFLIVLPLAVVIALLLWISNKDFLLHWSDDVEI